MPKPLLSHSVRTSSSFQTPYNPVLGNIADSTLFEPATIGVTLPATIAAPNALQSVKPVHGGTTRINGTVDHTVYLGQGGYGHTLLISSTGVIAPPYSSGNTGYSGVISLTNGDKITNGGTIAGGGGYEGANGGSGVDISAVGLLINQTDGAIVGGVGSYYYRGGGGAGGAGVILSAAGLLINHSAASVTGGAGGKSFNGSGGDGGTGIVISTAGSVLNQTAGVILGGAGGVSVLLDGGDGGLGVSLCTGTLTNFGTITGGQGGEATFFYNTTVRAGNGGGGVNIHGGTLINHGSISGGDGGNYAGNLGRHKGCYAGNGGAGVYINGGTLITSGTISGGLGGKAPYNVGYPGDAVQFGSNAATLVVEAGAVFNGSVVGDRTNDTLVLAGRSPGTLSGLGSQFIGFNTMHEDVGATWTLTGTNAMGTGTTFVDAGALSFLGTLTNSGLIEVAGGALSLLGDTTNGGTVDVISGTATFSLGIAGTGLLEIGAAGSLVLDSGAKAGQTVDFLASQGFVDLNHPLSFFGEIEGFGASDQIDLTKPTGFAETGYNYSGGVLTIVDNGVTVAQLNFLGNYTTASFSLSADGHNGVIVTFK